MAEQTNSHRWKPGESGNPRGRPPKPRALTTILQRAGSKTVGVDGKRIASKRLVAQLLWRLAATGEVVFPDGTVLRAKLDEWLEAIRFIYGQVDGPPKTDIDLTSGGRPIAAIREVVVELPGGDDAEPQPD